ncbi:MAG: hypothetical protein HY954_00930 [Deltaproteobacteria bacterium]|nr:hypothetical protein [Deltaproteobacteria bacterium]
MKMLKGLALVPLMVALLATGAMAKGYGAKGGGASEQHPGQSMITPGEKTSPEQFSKMEGVEFFTGRLTSIDPSGQELLVRTEVPGLLGPQTRDVPFRIDQDTTMNVCFESVGICDSRSNGKDGMRLLSSLEDLNSLASVDKDVIVVGDPDSNRIIHVQIKYSL